MCAIAYYPLGICITPKVRNKQTPYLFVITNVRTKPTGESSCQRAFFLSSRFSCAFLCWYAHVLALAQYHFYSSTGE